MRQVKFLAYSANETAESAMRLVKGMEKNINKLEQSEDKFVQHLKNFERPYIPPKAQANSNEQAMEKEIWELQVIATGLKEAQDEEDILRQVKTVINGLGAKGNYTDMFVCTDPFKGWRCGIRIAGLEAWILEAGLFLTPSLV